MRLAETLIALVHVDEDRAIELLTDAAKNVATVYEGFWLAHMRAKIGLHTAEDGDYDLIQNLLNIMQEGEADFTLTFRRLSNAIRGEKAAVCEQFKDPDLFNFWETEWHPRLDREKVPIEDRAAAMDKVNPIYIPRNHKVEEALSAAVDADDLTLFEDMLSVVSAPFQEVFGRENFIEAAPITSVPYQTFCGT
tara:strand:- start:304 stop:882 length:579 start_codon:yes stop_codon:yes gene_type:complete